MKPYNEKYIVVLDLETTGLDIVEDRVLELAFLVVDTEKLVVRDSFQRVIVPCLDWEERLSASPEAFAMHSSNGLINDVHSKGVSEEEAFYAAHQTLNRFSNGDQGVPFIMSGSCVACFDLPMLRIQYPEFADRFFYRALDASIGRAWVDLYGKKIKHGTAADSDHRALSDCRRSLDLMKKVRDSL